MSDNKIIYYTTQGVMLFFFVVACASARDSIGMGVVFLLMSIALATVADQLREDTSGETMRR